jgi:hypothetical protein
MWYFSTRHVARGHGSARMTEIYRATTSDNLQHINDGGFESMLKGSDFLTENYMVASPGFYAFPVQP